MIPFSQPACFPYFDTGMDIIILCMKFIKRREAKMPRKIIQTIIILLTALFFINLAGIMDSQVLLGYYVSKLHMYYLPFGHIGGGQRLEGQSDFSPAAFVAT